VFKLKFSTIPILPVASNRTVIDKTGEMNKFTQQPSDDRQITRSEKEEYNSQTSL
jgi:hypothetical protein